MVEPERLQPFELFVAGGGRDHGCARALGELNPRHSDAACSGVDQDSLALGEAAGGEQALVRGSECDRHARGARRVQPVGNRPGHGRRGRTPGRVRPGGVQGHHPVADRAPLHADTDLAHHAGAQIADHVRHGGQIPARASEQVTPLDADRLGVDHDTAIRAFRLGHIFVEQHPGGAGLVDHRRLHGNLSRVPRSASGTAGREACRTAA